MAKTKAPDVLYLVLFHVQDAAHKPIAGAAASSTGGPGPWQSTTNPCGDVIDPATGLAGVMLSAGDYSIVFSARGYVDRPLAVHIATEGPPIVVGLERGAPSNVLPPRPTRAQVCSVQHSLAGLTYHTKQYGEIPAWFYGKLNADDRAAARADHRKAGDTHIPIPITEAYREGGTLWPAELADGYDYTNDLDTYRAILTEAIADGFLIDAALGGDGLGSGPNYGDYNDPIGRTYGHQFVMAHMEAWIRALEGDGTDARPDLTPYISFRPGWDACFYSWGDPAAATSKDDDGRTRGLRWRYVRGPRPAPLSTRQLDEQQTRIRQFGELFRKVLPAGFLAIEHTPGNIPVGLGPSDWAPGGMMQAYDTLLSEYATVHEDSYWQVVARCIEPYHRPADQPAGDDPTPPKYLPGQETPRGPYFYVAFEPTQNGVYEWCRGRCSREAMQEQDRYMRATGVTLTGYPRIW